MLNGQGHTSAAAAASAKLPTMYNRAWPVLQLLFEELCNECVPYNKADWCLEE